MQGVKAGAKHRVAVIGSRAFEPHSLVARFVRTLPRDVLVVTGGARGVDTWAEEEARALGMEVEVHRVDTRGLPPFGHPDARRQYAIRAHHRNEQIVLRAHSVFAFWDRRSKGTCNAVMHAVDMRRPVEVVDCDGKAVNPLILWQIAKGG